MQPAPLRLTQCIRIAFKASRARPQPSFPNIKHYQKWANQKAICLCHSDSLPAYARSYPPQPNQARSLHVSDARKEPASYPPSTDIHDPSAPPAASTSTSPSSSSKQPNELPSHTESRRTELSRRVSHLMDNVQSNIFTASQRLNDLTGYSGIEALKKSIEHQEELVLTTRQAVKAARSAYSSAVATRSTTQREVNDLLQRKHNWSPSDLERFTSLYRSDHANEQAEQRAHDELGKCERAAEEASNALAKSILARYHEEQIWSDKIRQMSTWGTWGLMGVNILLFLIFQVAVEPWRRRRLVQGFEQKVKEALEREKLDGSDAASLAAAGLGEKAHEGMPADIVEKVVDEAKIVAAISMVDAVAPAASGNSSAIETAIEIIDAAEAIEAARNSEDTVSLEELPAVQAPFSEPTSGFAYYRDSLRDLFSAKKLVLTQRDVTTAVLQGAAGGAAAMGLLLVLLRPK